MNSPSDCRVLIVEDDAASREALASFLRRRGYDVRCAGTVAAGGAKLNEVTHLILDLGLPDGTGLLLLKRVHEQGLPVKVAIVTGLDRGDALADAVLMQPDVLLRKPVDFSDVIAWLENCRPTLHDYLGAEGSAAPWTS